MSSMFLAMTWFADAAGGARQGEVCADWASDVQFFAEMLPFCG